MGGIRSEEIWARDQLGRLGPERAHLLLGLGAVARAPSYLRCTSAPRGRRPEPFSQARGRSRD